MVYVGQTGPACRTHLWSRVRPPLDPSRPARARRHFAPLAYGSLLPLVERQTGVGRPAISVLP